MPINPQIAQPIFKMRKKIKNSKTNRYCYISLVERILQVFIIIHSNTEHEFATAITTQNSSPTKNH